MTPLPLAGLRRRLASLIYEFFLLIGVLAATFFLPHMTIGMFFHITLPGGILAANIVMVLAAYFVWCWRNGGQTLAMQTWKLQLVGIDGRKLPVPRLLLRYLLAWPSVMLGGCGLLWALVDRDRQFLHDRLAATRIVLKT